MEMNYCMQCGGKLHPKYLESEGREIPYCEACQDYRFPVFNTAVSMILTDQSESKVLLIQQYGKPFFILCAGYVNQGENAEAAAVREAREELGMTGCRLRFNRSEYFAPSNTLIFNFIAAVEEENAQPNWEVDAWRWFSNSDAPQSIKPNSLASRFLASYLDAKKAARPTA